MPHSRQAINPGTPSQPHQHRFRLIFPCMSKGHGRNAPGSGPGGHFTVSRIARSLLKIALTIPALPDQRVMRHTKVFATPGHKPRFRCCFRSELVIHRHGVQLNAVVSAKRVKKVQQSH